MANLKLDGFDHLSESLTALENLPDEVAEAMLDAEADVVLEAQRREAAKLGMYAGDTTHNNFRETSATNTLPGQTRSYSTGELARSLKKGKTKQKNGTRAKHIYFSGKRKRGKTTTTNSEIAFLNEYGSRTINARNFVRTANEKAADEAVEAAEAVYDTFLKSQNL